jgi:hypothetical protein
VIGCWAHPENDDREYVEPYEDWESEHEDILGRDDQQ